MFCMLGVKLFCFKQKTAYEMRISDWSSDVCSSDLDFGATWFARYFSHQTEDCQFAVDYGFSELCSDPNHVGLGGVVNAENKIGATTYHDVSFYWNTPWNGKITIGANNVFDRDPPFSVQAFANSFDPQYEVPGRFLYARISQIGRANA